MALSSTSHNGRQLLHESAGLRLPAAGLNGDEGFRQTGAASVPTEADLGSPLRAECSIRGSMGPGGGEVVNATPEARPGSGAVSGSPGACAHSPDRGTLALRGNFTQTHKVSLHRQGLACEWPPLFSRRWLPLVGAAPGLQSRSLCLPRRSKGLIEAS